MAGRAAPDAPAVTAATRARAPAPASSPPPPTQVASASPTPASGNGLAARTPRVERTRTLAPLDGGQPLPPALNDRMGRRFRRDFSAVRLHRGGAADRNARALGARAYTRGNDIAFRAGALEAPGGERLLAHELAHVVQQSNGAAQIARKADGGGCCRECGVSCAGDAAEREADDAADHVLRAEDLGPPQLGHADAAIQRQPAPDELSEEDDVRDLWLKLLEAKTRELEEIETGTGAYLDLDRARMPAERARATRELAILGSTTPTTYDELVVLEDRAATGGQSEADARAALAAAEGARPGSAPGATWANDLSWAFPSLWADRLAQAMKPVFDPEREQQNRADAWKRVIEVGALVPPYLVQHGLPVDFDQAIELRSFTILPAHAGLPSSHALHHYARAMLVYQDAYAREALALRYAMGIRGLVDAVRSGGSRIDATIFPRYASDRRWPPTVADLQGSPPIVNPFAVDEINPYVHEQRMFKLLLPLGIVDILLAGKQVREQYAAVHRVADTNLVALGGWRRLALANLWASEHGYPAFVREVIWKGIKQNLPDIAKKALVETGTFVLIQFIPVVNVIYDAYLVAKGAYGVLSAAWRLADAEREAEEANSVVALQRASAKLTLAQNVEALKMVGSALEAFGGWAAMRAAMKAPAAVGGAAAARGAGRNAARGAAVAADRVASGTVRELTLAGERHVLTILQSLGRTFIRMCSGWCGEIVEKLRLLLAHLQRTGAPKESLQAVTRVLRTAESLEKKLATMTQAKAEEQLAKLARSVEELGNNHPAVANYLPEIEALAKSTGIPRAGWNKRDINDPSCASGCEVTATQIQQLLGGKVHRIEPTGGPALGAYRGKNHGWAHHEVVVKDGMVFDAFTGGEGLSIPSYKAFWQYPEAIKFGF